MKLKLGDGLSIPIEIASQAVALVGIRGSGKTNTAGVIAEELLDRGQQIVVLDPTDAWWGLRSDYPVFIFGGPHGDLPLAETDGKTLAEFVVQEQVPIILSLRHLRKNAQRRLVMEFCEELYHLKGKPEYRAPLTVFMDEAPQFVPQRVMGEMARLVGAVQDMILLGRSAGFGVVMISQRFATLNADVRTQADTVIVHRLPSPLDRKALSEWIEENATIAEQKEVLSSLAKLQTGEAWLWAPYFGLFKQAQIRPRRTFDSSAAPKIGQTLRPPKDLTKVDLEKLKGKLSAAIEKAKADDPRELRKQIAELKKQIGKPVANMPPKPESVTPKTVEKFVLKDGQLARAEKLVEQIKAASDKYLAVKELFEQRDEALGQIAHELAQAILSTRNTHATMTQRVERPQPRSSPHERRAVPTPTASRPALVVSPSSNGDLSGPERKILASIAELEALNLHPADKIQVGLMAGYTNVRSGGFSEPLGRLVAGGYVEIPAPGQVAITDAGRSAVGPVTPPANPAEMQARIKEKLTGPERKLLGVLLAHYPTPITKEQLASECDPPYTNIRSGGFSEPLGRLNSLGIVRSHRGEVVAAPALFLEEQ